MKTIATLSDASPEVLLCRDLGHGWTFLTDTKVTLGYSGDVIEFTRVEQCFRCPTMKTQVVEVASMRITKSSMHYSDGYLMAKDTKITRADVRREFLQRLLNSTHNTED